MGKTALIYNTLTNLIVSPKSELIFSNNFELLISVMLSAQCTDKRVNEVTKDLFRKYPTPKHFACLDVSVLEEEIKSCNYYHNKAKHIIETSKILVDKFNGNVPTDFEDLISLPGVGNKTANVVRVVAFGAQVVPVDTHVLRVSNRLGLVYTKSPDVCSKRLSELFNNFDLGKVHHLLLLFGRYYCTARNSKCSNCPFINFCVEKVGE